MNRVYTIGYDARSSTTFIKLLKTHDIGLVVDVRRFPTSRFPQYRRELLEIILETNGIRYKWLGEYLGGFRGGYQEYMKTQKYWMGIKRLLEIVNYGEYGGYPAILCRERIPWRCHRRYIAGTLVSLGYDIYHIIDYGEIVKHAKIY